MNSRRTSGSGTGGASVGEGTLRVSLRAPGIAWGQQMDAYLELGKRLDEFHLAPRDDRDVGAAVGELAQIGKSVV